MFPRNGANRGGVEKNDDPPKEWLIAPRSPSLSPPSKPLLPANSAPNSLVDLLFGYGGGVGSVVETASEIGVPWSTTVTTALPLGAFRVLYGGR